MKIVHIALAVPFTETMNYQENLLVDLMVERGHDVTVLTSVYKFKDGFIFKVNEQDFITHANYRLIRKNFVFSNLAFKSNKPRKIYGLSKLLYKLNPDLIWFHGIQSLELITVAKYKKMNTRCVLIADNHADIHNSGLNFFSLNILHRFFYSWIINSSIDYIDTLFAVSPESRNFMKDVYRLSSTKLLFFPLGGTIYDEKTRRIFRTEIRNELNMGDSDVFILHSGKLDKAKETILLIRAFNNIKTENLYLFIIGSLAEEIKEDFTQLVESNDYVNFIGWKSSKELIKFMHACDLYIQPGGQSVSMQQAACSGCAVAVRPYLSHIELMNDCVYYIQSEKDIQKLINDIISNPSDLIKMKRKIFNHAKRHLNYHNLIEDLLFSNINTN